MGTLLGLILVLGLCYWAYLHLKNQGWTVDKALSRLGVQPDAAPAAAGAVAAPAPPVPVVDPNVCAFCGQRKDPVTGACACSLDAGGVGPAVASAPAVGGSGPRLVAVGGVAMGQIYPVAGETTIGRDPTNGVPLAMDTTVSRRHAVITADGGGYLIRDQGSSNGTFVNGQRVEESVLRPGDEVSIGGTRFRFEA